MVSGLIPSPEHDVFESRDGGPKVLELEGTWYLRPSIIGKQEKAVVGERREKGVMDVGAKLDVPHGTAKELV